MAPQIQEYTAKTDVLRPSETGVEALAMAGRRAGGFYDQAATTLKGAAADEARAAEGIAAGKELEARSFSGVAKSVVEAGDQAVVAETHQEIAHGAATFAQLHADLTDQWNGIAKNADPNDTSVAGKFREETLEPKLQGFVDSFSTVQGQQWAESHVAALRDHMFEKQSADMASRAGDAITTNVRQMTNAWSNTARGDPSSVPFLLATADSSIDGVVSTSPNLKGADAARLHSQITQKAKEDIIRAGALGAIENSGNPEAAAAAFAKRYPEYITPGEVDQFAKAARFYRHADVEGAKAAAAEQRRQATAAFHKDANQWELSTIDENGNSVMPPNLIKSMKDIVTKYGEAAEPSRVTAMVARVKELGRTLDPASAANERRASDATMRQIFSQPELPAPPEIDRLYANHQLTFADRGRALKAYQDDRSPDGETLAKARTDFFRTFASTIDPGRDQTTGAGASALGTQRIGDATMEARRMEGVLRSQGKDPHSLYDPRSPDYFGRPENITRFRPTLQEKAAFDAQVKADQARKDQPAAPAAPKVGDRKQFKQGWGVWNGTAWVPEQ